MKSIKRVLYPEKDVYGEGENVAIAYWEDLETPIYTLRAYDRMYIAYIYIFEY